MSKSPEQRKMLPEDVSSAELEKYKMEREGAVVGKEGSLIVTKKQIEKAGAEMIKEKVDATNMGKDLGRYISARDLSTVIDGLREVIQKLEDEATDGNSADLTRVHKLLSKFSIAQSEVSKVEEARKRILEHGGSL